MNRLELLQKEARKRFEEEIIDPGWQASYIIESQKWLTDLITHIYSQAIEDAKGVMPGILYPLDAPTSEVWNDYRAEAITALEKLRP